jgi:hypothetical protein
MIKYFLILISLINVYSFQFNFNNNIKRLSCLNCDKKNNIIDLEYIELIELFDEEIINNLEKDKKLLSYNTKNNIFEEYLIDQFQQIKDIDGKINFIKFYQWINQMGTFLNKDEIFNIYTTLIKEERCDLINFILINRIIYF